MLKKIFLDRNNFYLVFDIEKWNRYPNNDVNVTVYLNNHNYLIAYEELFPNVLSTMKQLLQKVLNRELILHPSITYSLGFLLDRLAMDKKDYNFIQKEGTYKPYWVGLDYLLCSTEEYDTWIYNKDEKIIFEITPWFDNSNALYSSHDEFINNYEPAIIVELTDDIVLNWLTCVEELLMPFQQPTIDLPEF